MYDIDGNCIRKVTCFIGIVCCFFAASCKTEVEKELENEVWQQKVDSIGNATLDSIYKRQVKECDSLQKKRIPILVDSLIKNDSIRRLLDKKK
jgi:hypothetical protein